MAARPTPDSTPSMEAEPRGEGLPVKPLCPLCNTALEPIDEQALVGLISLYLHPNSSAKLRQVLSDPSKQTWICPVAVEGQRRGLLGQPGKKHKEVMVYVGKGGDAE